MLRCFGGQQKKEVSPHFIDNGSALLEELITTFNGRQEIPIRSYAADELIAATNCFSEKVGETDYANMYKGFINERQVLVANSISHPQVFPSRRNLSIRNVAITSQMSQLKNVLKLSGCCLEFQYPALVYEFVEFETLENLLLHKDNLLPWRNRVKIASEIASTILYLHTSFPTPIIHRDLKPSNVIIDQHGVAKLFDFSLSISLPRGESQVEDTVMGTIGFIDPEYMASGFLTQKSDVYSFGIILLVLVTGQKAVFYTREIRDVEDYVKYHMEKDELSQMIDPKIVNQGFDQQQLQAILNLGIRCTQERGEDRPEMIDVARELRHIQKSAKTK